MRASPKAGRRVREHVSMSIEGFLTSRIEDDERLAEAAVAKLALQDSRLALTDDGRVSATGWRMLSETALKREMLFSHHDEPRDDGPTMTIVCVTCQEPFPCQSLRIAAAVYSDHPNYEPHWLPDEPDTRAG